MLMGRKRSYHETGQLQLGDAAQPLQQPGQLLNRARGALDDDDQQAVTRVQVRVHGGCDEVRLVVLDVRKLRL